MQNYRLVDDYIHLGHRRRLIQALRANGIKDEQVLSAIGKVPRHWFMGKAYEALAYEDRALPIGRGQTISQPSTVAAQTVMLDLSPRMKVLEIGTGSGYQAAVLGQLGARVFTLERHEPLHLQALQVLSHSKFSKVRCFLRDGNKGLSTYAPYDRILVTAGAAAVPPELLKQLAIGGKLVIPVGIKTQIMQRITRTASDKYQVEEFGTYKFVPFQQGLAVRTENKIHPRFHTSLRR